MAIRNLLAAFKGFLRKRRARFDPIRDPGRLGAFLSTRSAHVAQTSLYGYLRTRAGTRFPELFANDPFIELLNIAKWHIWLDSVADLAVFAGALLRRGNGAPQERISALMLAVVDQVLADAGTPPDAGPEFASHAERVRARISMCDWSVSTEDESAFSESPQSLVRWAPMVDDFKQLDAEIVRNSVRFRWQEIRRELRQLLDPASVLAAAATPSPAREDGSQAT
jgi:hypothetical protein